uniref:Uncharacterized protein n=1 Tax=Hucho hucho TaxID=62062 RepID=A0A4W5NVV3_9TELE
WTCQTLRSSYPLCRDRKPYPVASALDKISDSTSIAETKASSGWIHLHLACYFGHKDVVEELLKEVDIFLLRYDTCATIINGTAQVPKSVYEDDETIAMHEAAEIREEKRKEEKLLEVDREGDIFSLSQLVSI